MTSTIKQAVIKYLEGKDWRFGGEICRELAYDLKHKEAIIERHGLRSDLVKGDNPVILKRFVDNPSGKGAKVLQYKLNEARELEQREMEKGVRQTSRANRSIKVSPMLALRWQFGTGAPSYSS
jgi:hypothetical protein